MVRIANGTRRRRLSIAAAVLLTVAVVAGLYWFQPWKLWTNTVVEDALPSLAASPATIGASTAPETGPPRAAGPITAATSHAALSARSSTTSTATTSTATTSTATTSTATTSAAATSAATVAPPPATTAPAPATTSATLLASGTFLSHEHQTSGTAQLIRLPDGRRVLALKNLRTSNGPALHVWLSDAPVTAGSGGWYVFDNGRQLDLGELKGNVGNQVYPVGDDVELSAYSSVSIWCDRFSVSFGAAEFDVA